MLNPKLVELRESLKLRRQELDYIHKCQNFETITTEDLVSYDLEEARIMRRIMEIRKEYDALIEAQVTAEIFESQPANNPPW